MSETLSGIQLRRQVAEALGWRHLARVTNSQSDDWVGSDPSGGKEIVPEFESDPGTLPEKLAWLALKGWTVYITVYPGESRFHPDGSASVYADRTTEILNGVPLYPPDGHTVDEAVSLLVAAVADWEKGQAGK